MIGNITDIVPDQVSCSPRCSETCYSSTMDLAEWIVEDIQILIYMHEQLGIKRKTIIVLQIVIMMMVHAMTCNLANLLELVVADIQAGGLPWIIVDTWVDVLTIILAVGIRMTLIHISLIAIRDAM